MLAAVVAGSSTTVKWKVVTAGRRRIQKHQKNEKNENTLCRSDIKTRLRAGLQWSEHGKGEGVESVAWTPPPK